MHLQVGGLGPARHWLRLGFLQPPIFPLHRIQIPEELEGYTR